MGVAIHGLSALFDLLTRFYLPNTHRHCVAEASDSLKQTSSMLVILQTKGLEWWIGFRLISKLIIDEVMWIST